MSAAMEVSDEVQQSVPSKPAALLRGSARGLEIVIDAPAGLDAIADAINTRLAEAPTFFRGSDVRIRVEDGPLPIGSLARLEVIAATYELRIVEIGASRPASTGRIAKGTEDGVPQLAAPTLAAGSAPTAPRRARSVTEQFENDPTTESKAYRSEFDDVPTVLVPPPPSSQVLATALALAPALGSPNLEVALASARTGVSWVPASVAGTEPRQPSLPLELPVAKQPEPVAVEAPIAEPPPAIDQLELALRAKEILEELEPDIEIEPATRIVIGPVRSGVILDHHGHIIVFGDVNPGAEVRAAGNIVVLGRLRGLAHAGIGAEAGFILSLHLQPQQLRIGRMVARASDGDSPAIPEIAYVTNGSIVVERYQGRLPAGLAESLK